jgi:hypothetical protein
VRNTSIARRNLSILRRGRRLRRVEPDMPSQPEDDEGEVTDDIPQIECLWPRIQRARCNFWKANTPTVKQTMDKVKC